MLNQDEISKEEKDKQILLEESNQADSDSQGKMSETDDIIGEK